MREAADDPKKIDATKVDLRDGMYGYESAYYYYGSTSDVAALPKI
jgi:hypothetical protein